MGNSVCVEWDSWRNILASGCFKICAFSHGMKLIPGLFFILAVGKPCNRLLSWFFCQGGILVVVFFSISSNQPLLSQISLKKREHFEFQRMGQALGIPDSGLLFRKEEYRPVDPNEPLDKLLLNKRFRQSFMEFADRYSIWWLTSFLSRFCHLFKLNFYDIC